MNKLYTNILLVNNIEYFSAKYHVSKSKLTRNAIRNYLTLFEELDNKKNPKVILSQNLVKFSLRCMDEKQLEELAEISYRNGLTFGDFWTNTLNIERRNQNDLQFEKDWITFLLNHLTQQVFSTEGMNWFTETQFKWVEHGVIFTGNHNLGLNFSFFMKYLLEKYLYRIHYRATKVELEEDKISLYLTPRD